jgi:NADH dehydrogenase
MTDMPSPELHVVTGAFGYSGRYISQRLLAAGQKVRTLTDSPTRANPFGGRIEAQPFHFAEPARLVESLRGAAVLYNTYWVRFNSRHFRFADAVRNSLVLFRAAAAVPANWPVAATAKKLTKTFRAQRHLPCASRLRG